MNLIEASAAGKINSDASQSGLKKVWVIIRALAGKVVSLSLASSVFRASARDHRVGYFARLGTVETFPRNTA